MELMNNTSNIEGCTPKIIEFPKHFAMNTQLYDKQSLKPLPMKFYSDATLNHPFMLLQSSLERTRYFITRTHAPVQTNCEHNYQNIIQDKTDPNVFYVTYFQHNMANGYKDYYVLPCFYKMRYDDTAKRYTITNSLDYFTFRNYIPGNFNGFNRGDSKILCEIDKYFVINSVMQRGDIGLNVSNDGDLYSGLYYFLGVIDKDTFSYSYITLSHYVRYYFLEEHNNIVYLLADGIYSNSYKGRKAIAKLNLSTLEIEYLWESPIQSTNAVCNPVKIGNFYYVLYTDDNTLTYKILKIALDTTEDTVNTEVLDINLNNFILDSSTIALSDASYLVQTMRVIQTDSKTYISLLMHCTPNYNSSFYHQCKHALIEVSGTTFTVVDTISLTDGCLGSFEYGNSKHLILYMSDSIRFYVFDETKKTFTCTYTKSGEYVQVGLDSMNRVITQTTDRTVEILTDTNACILNADFNEDLYDKNDSSEIDATIDFYGKNILNEYIETEVKLSLIGPVVFKENNSNELIISTLKTGIRTVPVIITGCGSIEVIITQNT